MQEERFIIKYVAIKNCFVYLPEIFAKRLTTEVHGLKLRHNNNDLYVSWRSISGADGTLRISATFARILNIEEGNQVIVSSVLNPPYLSSLTVTPWNIQDWDIVSYQADKIQSVLLDQISLVAKNQSIVVWISKGLSITFAVDGIGPDFEYGKIGDRTEVRVEMPSGKKKSFSKYNIPSVDERGFSLSNCLNGISRGLGLSKLKEINESRSAIKCHTDDYGNSVPETFRVYNATSLIPIWSSDFFDIPNGSPYDVFVPESCAPKDFQISDNAKSRLYKIRKIREERRYINSASTDFLRTDSSVPKQATELVVRLFIIDQKVQSNREEKLRSNVKKSARKKIYTTMNLRRNLDLAIGSKVSLEPLPMVVERSVSCIVEILASSQSVTSRRVKEYLIERLYDKEILINSRSRIYLEEDGSSSCMVLRLPDDRSYLLLNNADLENVVINVTEALADTAYPDANYEEIEEINLPGVSLLPFKSIIAECRIVLELSLGLNDAQNFRYEPGNVLICGDVGVGKTTFTKMLRNMMERSPYFVHVGVIECRALKGKRAEAMHKILSAAMIDCVYHQPSILILDDIETIGGPPSSGEEESSPDAMNASRIMDIIFNISDEYQAFHYVSMIATCTNINKIGPKLRSPRGVHPFRLVLSIPDLEKEHRIDILRLALQNHIHVPEAMNWDYYGNKTEGWVAQDLIDFAEKASFASWKRHVKNRSKEQRRLVLAEEDLSETLKNYKTISLHGVQLYKNSGHDWSNIGGLENVKEVVTQLFKWPMQYPELYRNAPIKNQNGLLLYGMPGTGKTILAGAIAKECGVNFISVKGPELLSKYIGASEEAVRNVFEKARRAKPCVLFFDEFDSLAPRRGHDSTGVTDRVVNQLLTQLDGVEGREGVAIVAASSRPDLLDPALLRPGRLDKSLLCPLPREEDREKILRVLCKAQGIDTTNLDLNDLAKRSSGFTGADLNAVLTQAKYDALDGALSNVLSGQKPSVEAIAITQQRLIDSFVSTKPSLSRSEMDKYRRIYDKFSRGNVLEDIAIMKQKATLA